MKKWKLWAAGALIAVIVGIIMGLKVNLQPAAPAETGISFDEVLLGIPDALPVEGKTWDATSRLIQKRNYTTEDPLALRVVSSEPPTQQTELSVRLLEEDGTVQALTPASFTATGGTSGHCCWTVTTPGKYKLQIFTGTEAPLIVPITIVAAPKNVSPLKLKQ